MDKVLNKKLHKISGMTFLLCTILFLSGCMYPQENLQQNQVPYEDQVESVQKAVLEYRKDNGGSLLPIVTKDQDTPYYMKYIIDFKKLVPKYMSEIPGNAYENGGIFQYTLINEETNPTVRLIDLRLAETIRDAKLQIQSQGYPAFEEKIGSNVYALNYKNMGFEKEPTVKSPFTGKSLHLVLGEDGELYIDYTPDLYDLLIDRSAEFKNGEDIRAELVEDSLFVPAYSLPYTWDQKANKPVFMAIEE
jgi:hypothetical protein